MGKQTQICVYCDRCGHEIKIWVRAQRHLEDCHPKGWKCKEGGSGWNIHYCPECSEEYDRRIRFGESVSDFINDKSGITPQGVNTMTATTTAIQAAAIHGAKIAAAQEAEAVLLDLVKRLLGDRYAAVESMVGEKGIKALAPIALHYLVSSFPTQIPQAPSLAAACELATEGNAKDLILPLLDQIRPSLARLAEIGGAKKDEK